MTNISTFTPNSKWATTVPVCGVLDLYSHEDINRKGNEQPRMVGSRTQTEDRPGY